MLPRLAWRLQDWEDLVNCTHYNRSEYDLYGDSKGARGTEAQGGGDSGSGEGAPSVARLDICKPNKELPWRFLCSFDLFFRSKRTRFRYSNDMTARMLDGST